MAGTSSNTRLELLSKDNYDTWAMQIEALLTRNDLWGYANGTIQKPTLEAGASEAQSSTIRDWEKRDKLAKADLILSIQPSELKQVRGCETSNEIWIKLESIYASKGPARKATLLKQLMLQKLDEGGDVREHMNKFFDAVDKLESMQVAINGDLLSIMLLYSLPTSFENFRCAIESRDDLPVAETLKIKIIEESEARKQTSGDVVVDVMNVDKSVNKPKWPNGNKYKKIKCYICGKPGHIAKKCFKRNSMSSQHITQPTANNVDDSYAVSHTATDSEKSSRASMAWILDSGCTAHLCGDLSLFKSICKSTDCRLNLASHASAEVKGKGVVNISALCEKESRVIEFHNTLYVPDLRTNLISVSRIIDKGHNVVFRGQHAYVTDNENNIKMIADRRGDLYYLRVKENSANIAVKNNTKIWDWHQRLGHLNRYDMVKLIRRKIMPHFNACDLQELSKCEICLKGKMTASPFTKRQDLSKELLQIVHSDVVGPFRCESTNRSKYFVTFIDDCSRWCEIYFLRKKSGVFEAFKLYQALVERQTGCKIKNLQSDNGREYCNNEFSGYLARNGIVHRLTIAHTPQQNGVAERKNRTLLDMARCLLLQSNMPAHFWSEAVAMACYLRNRCPTNALHGAIPFEKWMKRELTLDKLFIFGAKVMVLNKNPNKDKLAQRSINGIFVGYPRDKKGYRVWVESSKQIVCARDVKVIDSDGNKFTPAITPVMDIPCEVIESENKNNHNNESDDTEIVGSNDPSEDHIEVVDEIKRAPGRPRIVRTGLRGRPRKLFQTTHEQREDEQSEIEQEFACAAEVSMHEAMNSENRNEWYDAIESEIISIIKNDTWEIVNKNDVKNVVGCRYVLTNKYSIDGQIIKRKARLVAKGYSQRYGIDYHQTFAPVARLDTLRLMLAISVQYGLKLRQFDVVTAYLNGTLNEEVYMQVPSMIDQVLMSIVNKGIAMSEVYSRAKKMLNQLRNGANVCKLKKALYGLRQAGRQWYTILNDKLTKMNLKPTVNEPCLFFNNHRNKDEILFVLIYVDDILIASNCENSVMNVKCELEKCFELKDIGVARYCLGLEINQCKDMIVLSQTGYALGLIKEFGMENCNPVSTPSEISPRHDIKEDNDSLNDDYPYRKIIGALMYLSVATRPDISNTISRLAQFVNNPRKHHWLAAKRVLRYLAGTVNLGLVYKKNNKSLIGYADSDWGGCNITRCSYTGYAFILNDAAIVWKSQKQCTVALSSTEAEYVSMSEATKEAIYLKSLLDELDMDEYANVIINVDNQSAQSLANNPMFHARTKHIDIKYHFIRDAVCNKLIHLKHVSSEEMIADVLTKPLVRVNHEKCIMGLGLKSNKDCEC